ncbi:hypothetical protein CcrKarma_gp181 [Caulobacter virus Karma]|uniref:Uncharacterized protein n=6 Tax=Viruses TaxID=10239 RepID=K4JPR9_9CAUD|nr:hypothetical protein D865_gp239 [Caulobacter phage phiCbK]YP_006988859.1 hypothetical protein CcrMagneto_gp177 [Caulobacter virus Magneto]YP_006989561.1 hypothetical protein CcrKarma_gp181 [Caulobacter virus Karma]YP_006989909.1 hypothetical protein D870_gp245 [Caulobacter phage CcrSwift]ARB13705.1 hypothetical protein Ccr10_gp175c [Caulobacter phage Ccr10]ARB14050.1 hypothetical protein Ccr2_gp174c [Caulobacter phage Ccr2]ARB14393.1 hypothetical protein Ccr5_gp173c [Caulobacter phage Ccr5
MIFEFPSAVRATTEQRNTFRAALEDTLDAMKQAEALLPPSHPAASLLQIQITAVEEVLTPSEEHGQKS